MAAVAWAGRGLFALDLLRLADRVSRSGRIYSPTPEDWVWSSCNSIGRLKAFLWLIGRVLRACPRFDSHELFHLEQALSGWCLPLEPRVDKRVGHGAGSCVLLGRVEHLLAIVLVCDANIVRFGSVLVAGHLAIEVAKHGLDGSCGAQGLPVGEIYVLIRRDNHRRGKLLLALSTRTSIPQLA